MRSINSGPSRRDKDKDKGDGEGGGMRSSHDAQVLRERAERLLSENTDLQRRIKDKDERSAELQRLVTTSQQRASKAAEALAVEQAERKQVEQAVQRAEAQATELRSQLHPLQVRVDRAEGEAAALRAQVESAAKQNEQSGAVLTTARQDTARVEEQRGRLEQQLTEVRADAAKREVAAFERASTLEAQRDEARAEAKNVQQALSTLDTEKHLLNQALQRVSEQADAERASMRELLTASQERLEYAMREHTQEVGEKERAVSLASVAQAEKRMLHELSSRVHDQLLHERQAAQVRRRRAATPARLERESERAGRWPSSSPEPSLESSPEEP